MSTTERKPQVLLGADTIDFVVQSVVKDAARRAGVELRRFVRWDIYTEPAEIVIHLTNDAVFHAPLRDLDRGAEAIKEITENLAAYMFITKDHIHDDHRGKKWN